MKLKLYHAAAAAAMALSVMLLTACGSPKQADPLPIIKLRTVGSSSEAACQRIGEALSELTAEKFGFTVEISQQSTTNYNAELERELLLGKEPDIFCYTDAENMFSLAADGTAEPLDDWLEEFPTLKEAVSQDRWNCMRYDGKLIAVPGNNPSAVAIGFDAPMFWTSWASMRQASKLWKICTPCCWLPNSKTPAAYRWYHTLARP